VFLSEFNVQLLYLLGLKNVVADFLSCPLPESTETVAATAATDPVDFEEMAAEQYRCAETQHLLSAHPSNLLSARQTPNAWLVTSLLVFFDQLSPKKIFFLIFIMLLSHYFIQVCVTRIIQQHHRNVFLTSILIWWAHCSIVIVLIIFLPLLIAHPNGWKLLIFLIGPRQHAQKP
jgi:hypothetical protein